MSSIRSIEEASELFLSPGGRTWAPYFGVLGPPGCGKSGFLRNLRERLKEDELAKKALHLWLDLRQVSIDAEERMYLRLASLCLAGAGSGLGSSPAMRTGDGARAFDEVLREILASRSSLLLYLDNLESIPRYFARALSRKLRQLYEEREDVTEYRRLGVILAGSLSLFELRQDDNSVLSISSHILLPFLDRERRRELVHERLLAADCTAGVSILELLAFETGGEPAFLDPLLEKLCHGKRDLILDEASISKALEELSSRSAFSLPILQDVGLHIYDNMELLDIVRQLTNQHSYVAPRDPTVDIDRFHLMGAVVLDQSTEPQCYRFRNGMVARYCRNILSLPLLQTRNVGFVRNEPVREDSSFIRRIESIELLRLRIRRSLRIWDSLAELREAWHLTTLYPAARTDLYLYATGGVWWWFDSERMKLKARPVGESDEAPIRAVAAALRERRPSFGLDAHDVAFAVPLQIPGPAAFLVVQGSRTDLDGALGENALVHWYRLVQEFAAPLESRALAEFGLEALDKRTEAAKGIVAQSTDFEKHIEVAQKKIERQVDRMLDVVRLGTLGVILILVALGLRGINPLVAENLQEAGAMTDLISGLLTILALVAALLGYRFDPLHIWRRIRNRLRPRLIEKRLRRLRRLLE